MDTTDPEIVFDRAGICNHCHSAQRMLNEIRNDAGGLDSLLERIKEASKGKEYDCLIGLSGGVDSSMVLDTAVIKGLRPLCFTVDNGWNDPRADENIMRMVEHLRVPFYRYTIDIPKFRSLQASFLQSGTANLEIPTDHILMATSYEMAAKYGIKYILSGGNVATESIMPKAWGYNARDLIHIKAIHKQFSGEELAGLPLCSLGRYNWYRWVKRIKTVYLLDYYKYIRADAIAHLEKRYGYKPYGEKHCESIFTSWFQNYYLFEKFGYDKRKAHYSSLINSGQMTRKEALEKLEASPVYPEFGLENRIMKYPKRTYDFYPTDEKMWNFLSKVVKTLRAWK